MAAATTWFEGLAPDVTTTVRRFPFAIVLAALATAAALPLFNEFYVFSFEDWFRLFLGFACGAVCAVAGVFVVESRPTDRKLGFICLYAVPLVFFALAQVRDLGWVAPPLGLPAVSLLWLSVSPVTMIGRGETRERQQNLFWWMNHQAIATAAIAAAGFLIIAVGIGAIERSLVFLFGIETGDIFYRWVLPVTGLFLTPVYWLSTLPKASDFSEVQLERPDFIATAVGFLGQFVLVPLLFIYALILLAYTGMIAVTQELPQGTIGWMVLGFVVIGAAALLVLHPPFMRTRRLVRLFRASWFWLTLVPLALFFLAVWVRVDAYGLTSERVLLIAGGVWAAILAAVFLAGRGDIRLIPGLAGVILALLIVGPWNYVALPNYDQGARLSRLLGLSEPSASVAEPQWDEGQAQSAASAIHYLFSNDHGKAVLEVVLLGRGIVFDTEGKSGFDLMAELGYPQTVQPQPDISSVRRDPAVAVDVSATPFYLRPVEAWRASMTEEGMSFAVEQGIFRVFTDGVLAHEQDLADWAIEQPADSLTEPWVDFTLEGRHYRLVLTSASWRDDPLLPDDPREVTNLTGLLFGDRPDPALSARATSSREPFSATLCVFAACLPVGGPVASAVTGPGSDIG